jgi:hypothetical protein
MKVYRPRSLAVIPAKAGIQELQGLALASLGPRFCGGDEDG